MPHTIYTFTLHRLGVLLVAVGALVVAGLLFTAGWVVGARRAEQRAKATSAAPVEAAAPAGVPPSAASAAPTPATPGAAPPGSTPSAAAPAAGSSLLPAVTFALEIGTFVSEEQAKVLVDELQQHAFEPVVVEQKGPRGHSLFRVMVGSYASRVEATKAAEAFAREEDWRAVVVEARLPKPGNGSPPS